MIYIVDILAVLFIGATLLMVVRSESRAEREMFALRLVILAGTWAALHWAIAVTSAV